MISFGFLNVILNSHVLRMQRNTFKSDQNKFENSKPDKLKVTFVSLNRHEPTKLLQNIAKILLWVITAFIRL